MNSLVKQLQDTFPHIVFEHSDDFSWSPRTTTVHYNNSGDLSLLLHELSHGLLGHTDYSRDVELLAMETAAWEKAKEIGASYSVPITDETVDLYLETYREWLHARSTCPECDASGYQTDKQGYRCIACDATWRVNEARTCGLKRYKN